MRMMRQTVESGTRQQIIAEGIGPFFKCAIAGDDQRAMLIVFADPAFAPLGVQNGQALDLGTTGQQGPLDSIRDHVPAETGVHYCVTLSHLPFAIQRLLSQFFPDSQLKLPNGGAKETQFPNKKTFVRQGQRSGAEDTLVLTGMALSTPVG